MFYRFVESVLTFSFICWFLSISIKYTNEFSRVVKVCSNINGTDEEPVQEMYDKRVDNKANSILPDSSHQLHQRFKLLPSGSLYRLPSIKSNRYKRFFIPTAIFSSIPEGRGSHLHSAFLLILLISVGFFYMMFCGLARAQCLDLISYFISYWPFICLLLFLCALCIYALLHAFMGFCIYIDCVYVFHSCTVNCPIVGQ